MTTAQEASPRECTASRLRHTWAATAFYALAAALQIFNVYIGVELKSFALLTILFWGGMAMTEWRSHDIHKAFSGIYKRMNRRAAGVNEFPQS